jgi:hypothetical protein
VSLNASRIAEHRGLRASAAQTLLMFTTPLFISSAVLTPAQPDPVIGGELIGIGLAASWALLTFARMKRGLADDDLRLTNLFSRRWPNVLVMMLFVAGGITLASGASAGLYLLLPASLVAFVSGVLNAWHFLLPPTGGAAPEAQGGRRGLRFRPWTSRRPGTP